MSFEVLAKIFPLRNVIHLKEKCFLLVKRCSFLFCLVRFFNLTHQMTEI